MTKQQRNHVVVPSSKLLSIWLSASGQEQYTKLIAPMAATSPSAHCLFRAHTLTVFLQNVKENNRAYRQMTRNCSRVTLSLRKLRHTVHTVTLTFTIPGTYANHERHKAVIGLGAMCSLSCLSAKSQQELITLWLSNLTERPSQKTKILCSKVTYNCVLSFHLKHPSQSNCTTITPIENICFQGVGIWGKVR